MRGSIIQYRKFGKLDWQVSALGLGTARLPLDEVGLTIIRYAIDHGVNYLDIPYLYDAGKRQAHCRLVAAALDGGFRSKIKIALALPVSVMASAAAFSRYLDGQLESLGVDVIDFGILGWLDRQKWPGLRERGVLSWLESAASEGKIKNVGFAFHDDYQTLRSILNDYGDFTLCQVKYSYMDVDHHPGISGIRLAAERGLAVVVSEPLKGGRLVNKLPASVAAVWGDALREHSLAEWALRWVWHHPEIAAAVSDVSTPEQLEENIALADVAPAQLLTVREQVLISRVRDAYQALRPIACTTCRGCMPCPRGIDVPHIFELYNDAVIYEDREIPCSIYREEGHDIGSCNVCGLCENACGRNIPIIDWLKKARQLFED